MHKPRTGPSALGVLILAGLLFPGTIYAAYPEKPVFLLVGYPPDGRTPADVIARTLGPKLQERLGQPFIVDNRPGAGGTLVDDIAARAAPDGYTLLLGSSATTTAAALRPDYTAYKRLQPVGSIATSSIILFSGQSAPFKDFPGLIEYAKVNPGKLNYASAGVGSGAHLSMELLKALSGVNIVHIPYKSVGETVTALLSGEVQLRAGVPVSDERMRPLAALDSKRSSLMPDVPSVEEFGDKGFFASFWTGVLVPLRTPRSIVDLLNREVRAAVTSDEMLKQRLRTIGSEVSTGSPEELAHTIAVNIEGWTKLVNDLHIKSN